MTARPAGRPGQATGPLREGAGRLSLPSPNHFGEEYDAVMTEIETLHAISNSLHAVLFLLAFAITLKIIDKFI